jgi:hypothetical protein
LFVTAGNQVSVDIDRDLDAVMAHLLPSIATLLEEGKFGAV